MCLCTCDYLYINREQGAWKKTDAGCMSWRKVAANKNSVSIEKIQIKTNNNYFKKRTNNNKLRNIQAILNLNKN